MKNSEEKIPLLPLLYHNRPVHFLCKTMQQVETERTGQHDHPHRHNYYTIIWIEKGEGIHHIDFKSYPLERDTIFFISPEQVHHIELKGKPQGYVLLFTTDFLESNGIPSGFLSGLELFFACDEVTPLTLKKQHLPEIKNYVEHIFREFSADHYLKNESIGTWLKLFLIACKRVKADSSLNNPPLQSNESKIIRDFKSLLEKQYSDHHKVSEYAAQLHFTSNYLNEVIKEETGYSAKDFIQNRIMLEAKRLAIYSDLSLKEIAFQLGYEDPAHFSKFFKIFAGSDFTTFKDQIRKKYL